MSLPADSASSATDSTTTVAELRQVLADFVADRDWSQFHSPKNVSMALAIEVAELMEHFQWLTTEASRKIAEDPAKLAAVREELADVVGYSFVLANELGIDVSSAMRAKMVKNRLKYPAEEFRGRYGPEDDGRGR
jgi:NTP pyrophosphatase (non-canonical NTP hydrolase)